MVQRGVPLSTEAPFETLTADTVPSQGDIISFSIFIASKIISTSPFLTAEPADTFTERMVPGIGLLTVSPPAAGAATGAAATGAAGVAAGAEAAGAVFTSAASIASSVIS